MILDASHKNALLFSLLDYVENPDDFDTEYGIIGSSSFDEIPFGFSPEKAQSLVEQLILDNLFIEDNCLEDILSIVLTHKELLNFSIKDEESSDDDIQYAKTERAAQNALIRYIKTYCSDNGISLSEPDSE